ncbi:MAG: hypothetical protein C0601_11270 [Candidatus Muiribacterium halophilum]|uniref:Outer membrane lipoprotein BamD-like domain-containing protein n=1 Tax=Muiribacterium halophilum TaxID=2053465 RepID=A0A2N5ZC75_MUIH1|nr:MAG: hypothetical protein C0601_11270 [Candidatus Muirbacterium halophilum]
MRSRILCFFCILAFFISTSGLSVDSLQVEEARKSMEKAFTDYANYISANSSDDDYANRLYHNYINLKDKYQKIKELYEASQYSAKGSEKEYFFSPHEEARLQTEEELTGFKTARPDHETDYRIGWLLYINGDYTRALKLFEYSIKKAKIENVDYYLPYLGISQVYLFLAEKSKDEKANFVNRSEKAISTFVSNYSYSDDINDKKRKYLAEEIKKRLKFLKSTSDN